MMIVYGQKGEYIEATWVKNEWGRYLKKEFFDKLNNRVSLEGIKIKKKAQVKKINSVSVKKVEQYEFNANKNDDELLKYQIETIYDLINSRKFDDVRDNLNKIIEENPESVEARFALFLCDNKLTYSGFYSDLNCFNKYIDDISKLIPF